MSGMVGIESSCFISSNICIDCAVNYHYVYSSFHHDHSPKSYDPFEHCIYEKAGQL